MLFIFYWMALEDQLKRRGASGPSGPQSWRAKIDNFRTKTGPLAGASGPVGIRTRDPRLSPTFLSVHRRPVQYPVYATGPRNCGTPLPVYIVISLAMSAGRDVPTKDMATFALVNGPKGTARLLGQERPSFAKTALCNAIVHPRAWMKSRAEPCDGPVVPPNRLNIKFRLIRFLWDDTGLPMHGDATPTASSAPRSLRF